MSGPSRGYVVAMVIRLLGYEADTEGRNTERWTQSHDLRPWIHGKLDEAWLYEPL